MRLRSRRVVATVLLAAVGLGVGASTASADYRSEVLADSPFAYHRLDETDGNAGSATVMANEGSTGAGIHNQVPPSQMNQVGALTTQSPNRAIRYFDTGVPTGHSYGGLPGSGLADFSIEFWVKTTQTPAASGQWFTGKGLVDAEVSGVNNDFGTALMSGGKVAFGLGSPDITITSVASVNNGAWHHVVATRAGTAMKIYIDGALDVSGNAGPAGQRSGTDYAISDINGAGTNEGLDGSMDEVALYADDLTAAAITRHFTAATAAQPQPPPPRQITVLANIDSAGALGSGAILGTDGLNCPELSCGVNLFEGDVSEYVGIPFDGSRFAGFRGSDCPPIAADRCQLTADAPGGVEVVFGAFHKLPATLGGDMFDTFNADAGKLEGALDDGINPKNAKAIKFAPVTLQRCACEIGDMGGALVVNIAESQKKLISDNGSGLISDNSSSFTPTATSVKGAAGVISDNGLGLIGNAGGTLIGPDGATLVGNSGNTIVSDQGAGRVARGGAAARAPKDKQLIYPLGSYGLDTTQAGDVTVKFTPTKTGKKIMQTFGEVNLELKRRGKKPIPLEARYVEMIRPADGVGTGGAQLKLSIK